MALSVREIIPQASNGVIKSGLHLKGIGLFAFSHCFKIQIDRAKAPCSSSLIQWRIA